MQEVMKSAINANEEKSSVVKLEEKFFRNGNIKQIFAYFSENNVTLKRVQDDKVKNLVVSAEAADDFAASWTAFRAESRRVDDEEEARKTGVAFEVTAICSHYPEIVFQKHQSYNGGEYWSVSVEKLNGYYNNEILTIDALLKEVQEVKERLDARWAIMTQVRAILKTNPEITLDALQEKNPKEWYVQAKCNDWQMHARYSHDITQLLEQTQAALADLTTVKEAYRLADEHGFVIMRPGSGWEVSSSSVKMRTDYHTHDALHALVHDFIAKQAPETAQTDTTPSHDEMQMLEAVCEHLDENTPVTPAVQALFAANKSVSPEEKINLF